ncbi:hypothetical protein AK88_05292 [Plasmodium fragile]|uniref:Schizont-infected cell agglutination C-terminal domain-containing protein n=1 Tax=Plasmodium fragile TaxID=5857 RepID=A0A0D9QDG5_PLAFR|nr:uncharacterized protein AK88_05292 [Plasmodium fragile]KJP85070.1 hypothetical protein AK88_05292 [Plasmodium fragile]
MQDREHDTFIQPLCDMHQDGDQAGEIFNESDKAVCWLVLEALSFKHGIQWMRGGTHLKTVQPRKQGDQTVMPYMKCILTNIFMKRIIGETCLRTGGGTQAFLAAQDLVRKGQEREPNMACEEADRKDGTKKKGENTEDWNLLTIMDRWLDRNKGYLRDGEVGVLGPDCTVERNKSALEIKEEATKKIEELGKEIEEDIQSILKEINDAGDSRSMDDILKRVQQGTHSSSTAPKVKNDVVRPPPPRETSAPSTQAPYAPKVNGSGKSGGSTGTDGKTGADNQSRKDKAGKDACTDDNSHKAAVTIPTREGSRVSVTPVEYTYEGKTNCELIRELERTQKNSGPTPGTVGTPGGTSRDISAEDTDPSRDDKTPGEAQPQLDSKEEKAQITNAITTNEADSEDGEPRKSEVSPQPSNAHQDKPTGDTTRDTADTQSAKDSSSSWIFDFDPDPLKSISNRSPDYNAIGGGTYQPHYTPLWGIDMEPSPRPSSCAKRGDGESGTQNGWNGYGGGVNCAAAPYDKRCDLKLTIPFDAKGRDIGGHYGTGPTPDPHDTSSSTRKEDVPLDVHDLTNAVLTATAPILFFLSAVTVALLGYSLWKYFAYLAKRRRTYRTVRDVPSPPLDEEILQHLQRGEPPRDYGYTLIRDRRAASTCARRRRHPRAHKRTIIELHLEVLHECEATEWENVKEDYWKIVVEQFAQELMRDLMRDDHRNNNILGVSTSDHGSSPSIVSSTLHPSTDSAQTDPCPPHDPDPWSCMKNIQLAMDPSAPNAEHPDPWSCMETIHIPTAPGPPNACDSCSCMETIQLATHPCRPNEHDPWSCMENIQLATDPCAPDEDDPWSCMENIQLERDRCPPNEEDPDAWSCMDTIHLDTEPDPHSSPRHECPIPDDINWINWIDRNKHIVRACTTQPWFLQLKAEWKQHLHQHWTDEVSGHRELGDPGNIPSTEMKKLRLWNEWVATQHRQLRMHKAEWFQHLLNTVQEETVSEKGAVPAVENDLEVDTVMGTEHIPIVRDVPRSQPMHQHLYMNKPLTAKICILLLALVIEQCEVERSLQEQQLYVDDLLQKCSH